MIVFVFGTVALLAFLAWVTWRSARVLHEIVLTTSLLLLPAENLLRLALIVVCVVLARVSGLPDARFGWGAMEPARGIVVGLVVGITIAMIVPLLTHLAVTRFGAGIYSPIVIRSVMPRHRHEWLLVPLALVPAVLLEELLFRSLLLGGFGVFASPLLLAVVWSIIFGAMHLPQGTLGIVVAAALGVFLSALFLATQSLAAPCVAHYVINLLQLVWVARDKSFLGSLDAGAGSHL